MAEQLTTERRVALKVLVRYADHVSVERLLAEARVTSRLHSDHIVQVIDAGVDAATSAVFVVMELLSGTTLEDRVMEGGPCAPEEALEFLRQVGSGLDKAHQHVDRTGQATPVVHRDLKPSNLFLARRDDGSPLIKILDFGAAKVLSPTTRASGVIRGTPQYMAYEQVIGAAATPATDIWAFGLIAFFLLTGRSYWLAVERDGTQVELFAEILNLPLVPASQRARELGVPGELGPAFDAWFSRCVHRDAAQRFRGAGAAARELGSVLGAVAQPARATNDAALLETLDHGAVASSRGLSRTSRTRAVLSTLGVVLVGGAGAAATLLWKQPPANEPEPSASAQSSSAPPLASSAPSATPLESAAAARPSAPGLPSLGASPAPAASEAPRAPRTTSTSKKRPSRSPPAPPKESPPSPSRDVYEQR